MTMVSFKQVESNYGKKEPSTHCLNFGYRKYGITIFSIRTQNGCTRCMKEEKICEVNNF